ncbi:unnamed protein product, partial [Darwinula stevensoni]
MPFAAEKWSGYFERVLRHDGSQNPVFYFFGVDAHLLKLLIGFIYVGEVDIPSVDLERFIRLAEALEVKGLKDDHSKRANSSVCDAARTSMPNNGDAFGHRSRSSDEDFQYSPSIVKAHRREFCRSADPTPRVMSQGPVISKSPSIASTSSTVISSSWPTVSLTQEEPVIKKELVDVEEDSVQAEDMMHSGEQDDYDEESQSFHLEVDDDATRSDHAAPKNVPPEVDPS